MIAVENMDTNAASSSNRGEGETRDSSYISVLSRRIVPCAAENKVMYSMFLSVSKAQKCRIEQNRVDEKGNARWDGSTSRGLRCIRRKA